MLAAPKKFLRLSFPARTHKSKKDFSQALQFSPAVSVNLSEIFFCDQQLPFSFSPVWVGGDVRRSFKQNNFGGNYESTA